MEQEALSPLQVREVFHLEFLRSLARKMGADQYALKGGVNLRLFCQSVRYSEDMDIDVQRAGGDKVRKIVMDILSSKGFSDTLRTFGIKEVVPPDIHKTKQTTTTQRFKVHLLTLSGLDLFTKVEFSRRGIDGKVVVDPVPAAVLRPYRMPSFLVPHYDAASAVQQKVNALLGRNVLQARDIFDLFLLSSLFDVSIAVPLGLGKKELARAEEYVLGAEYLLFRDTVVAYLAQEEQDAYSSVQAWDGIRLAVVGFLKELSHG